MAQDEPFTSAESPAGSGRSQETARETRQVVPGEIAARIDRLPLSPVQWEMAILTQIAWGIIVATDGIAAILYPFIWKPQHVVSSFDYSLVYGFEVGVGILIGDYTMGFLADRIGRRPVLLMSSILAAIFIWPFGYITSFPLLIIFSILQTLGVGGVLSVNAVYMTEVASPKIRGKMVLASQTVAVVIFTILTGLIPHYMIPGDYRQFLFLLAGLQIVILLPLLAWRLPESPRWLEAKGHVTKALAVLERMEARCQRRVGTLPPPDLTQYQIVEAHHVGPFEVFQGRYRWRTVVLLICWVLGYGGIIYGSAAYRLVFLASRGYSAGFTFMLAFIAGIIGAAVLGLNALIGERIERKTAIMIGAVLFAGGWYFLYSTRGTVATEVFFTIMNVGTTIWLWNMYIYTPNAFATRIRALGTGWTDGLGHMGAWGGVVLSGVIFAAASPLGWILLVTIPGALVPGVIIESLGLRQRQAVLEDLST